MKRKYTKEQIKEAIGIWKRMLEAMGDVPENPQTEADFDAIEKHFRDSLDDLLGTALDNYAKTHRDVDNYYDCIFDFIADDVKKNGLIEDAVGPTGAYTDDAFVEYLEQRIPDYIAAYADKNSDKFTEDGYWDKDAEARRQYNDTAADRDDL